MGIPRDGRCFGYPPRASVFPIQWEEVAPGLWCPLLRPRFCRRDLWGCPPCLTVPVLQAEALHLLQVPREGDERHRGQRVQRGVGVAHHPAGGSVPRGAGDGALGISGASPPASTPQPPRRPPPSSPSPRTPPPRCSSAGRYCPLCPLWGPAGRWHRGVAVPARTLGALQGWGSGLRWPQNTLRKLGTAISGCPSSENPLPTLFCSPQLRTRSMGSCWVSASATASCSTTACAASPCAASATPVPRGQSSPVSPRGPGGTWGHRAGGWHSGGSAGQGSVLRPALTPASCTPLPGASPELARLSCGPWSCHRPLCVTVPSCVTKSVGP